MEAVRNAVRRGVAVDCGVSHAHAGEIAGESKADAADSHLDAGGDCVPCPRMRGGDHYGTANAVTANCADAPPALPNGETHAQPPSHAWRFAMRQRSAGEMR